MATVEDPSEPDPPSLYGRLAWVLTRFALRGGTSEGKEAGQHSQASCLSLNRAHSFMV
jgi:hypothetical protein